MRDQKWAVEETPERFYLPVGLGPSFCSAFFLVFQYFSAIARSFAATAKRLRRNETLRLTISMGWQGITLRRLGTVYQLEID